MGAIAMDREWPELDFPAYHAHQGISSGSLKCFASAGPLEWWACYLAKRKQRPDTDATRLGRGFHQAIADPGTFNDWYIRIPLTYRDDEYLEDVVYQLDSRGSTAARPKVGDVLNMNHKAAQMYRSSWEQHAALQGKEYLTDDDIDLIRRQIDACWDNHAIREYLEEGGIPERACIWTCPKSGMVVKALADRDYPDIDTFLEFKTTKGKNNSEFLRDYEKFGYRYQGAHYRYVLGRGNAKCVSITGRFKNGQNPEYVEAQIYDISEEFVSREHDKNLETLQQIATLFRQVDGAELDSDGIPDIFHNEGWGAEIDPLDLEKLVWHGAEVMEPKDA